MEGTSQLEEALEKTGGLGRGIRLLLAEAPRRRGGSNRRVLRGSIVAGRLLLRTPIPDLAVGSSARWTYEG